MRDVQYTAGTFVADTEFHFGGHEGDPQVPVCLVVKHLETGEVQRYRQEQLAGMKSPPFPVDGSARIVAYFASAELSTFSVLGWPAPANVVDLYAEFRCLTNGVPVVGGNGLLGAAAHFGVPATDAAEKEEMRQPILGGGPWCDKDWERILDYCQGDVEITARLFKAMEHRIDWPRALLRGRYCRAVSSMELAGIPLDMEMLSTLRERGRAIASDLIESVDRDYGVFEKGSFSSARFERYLVAATITWPRLDSGRLDLREETFRDMARSHPQLAELHQLRVTLGQVRELKLTVGRDGRNRSMLSPFKSKTGRNQPSTSRFIFGPSAWLRGLIRPPPGYGLAYVDYSQQEFGIAAALSSDERMKTAYASGDPYLAFAKQAGAVPASATKETHGDLRELYKQCALAVQYGMGEHGLARKLGKPLFEARRLLQAHHHTYRRFWQWSDGVVDHAMLKGVLWTTFGWTLRTGKDPNDRSLRNFPMQANGAEMLRLAAIELVRRSVRVCAPIHDAFLIEASLADLDNAVRTAQSIMRDASAVVLDGFELRSDAKIVRYPDRYMDPRGVSMWNRVMTLLDRTDVLEGGRE